MGKHDVVLGPMTVNGEVIGQWVRPRTALEAFEERVRASQLRKLFNEAIASSKENFRTPIFGAKNEPDDRP